MSAGGSTLLPNAKSPKPGRNIAEDLGQWLENTPLGVQPTIHELTGAIRSLANGKAIGSDGVSVEPFEIRPNGDPALRRRLLDIVVFIWRGARCRSSGNMPSSWYSIKSSTGRSAASAGESRW